MTRRGSRVLGGGVAPSPFSILLGRHLDHAPLLGVCEAGPNAVVTGRWVPGLAVCPSPPSCLQPVRGNWLGHLRPHRDGSRVFAILTCPAIGPAHIPRTARPPRDGEVGRCSPREGIGRLAVAGACFRFLRSSGKPPSLTRSSDRLMGKVIWEFLLLLATPACSPPDASSSEQLQRAQVWWLAYYCLFLRSRGPPQKFSQ